MKKFFKIVFWIALLVVFAWTLYFLSTKGEVVPVVYDTESPFVSDVIKKTVATGAIVPRKEVDIKPQVSGIVQAVFIEAGQKIQKGDLLARVQIIPNMVNLNNAENRLNRAKIDFDNAKKDLDRNKQLLEKKAIAPAEFQPVEYAYNNAKEELEAAENNLQLIKEGVTKTSGKSSNNNIRATISGMVLSVLVKEGNSVIESNNFNDGTTIAAVADMSEMIFEGKVDESEVGKIKEGMDLIIQVGAIESVEFRAKLEYISPKGVEENGAIQFQIRAAMILRDDHFIRAGYSANADIVLDRRDSVLVMSEALLQFAGDSTFVEVMEGEQQFVKRLVEVGLSDGINVEVLSGVGKEDKIKLWNRAPAGEQFGM